jgi:GTPase SAR1 family protein
MKNTENDYKYFHNKLIGFFKNLYSSLQYLVEGEVPASEAKDLYIETKRELQTKIIDLEKKEYRIAFVGGFNSGKSTLINAILGDYILPEAGKALTAVPTFIKRSVSQEDEFIVHYLSKDDVFKVKRLYRRALAEDLGDLSAVNLGDDGIIDVFDKKIKTSKDEGLTSHLDVKLLEHFKKVLLHEKNMRDKIRETSHSVECSREKAFSLIKDELEAAFIEKIEVRLKDMDIPHDVVIVDLPGVSVHNPRHRDVTLDFIKYSAHAIVLVLSAKRILDKDENLILKGFMGSNVNIQNKFFWVINQWDLVTDLDKKDIEADFEDMCSDLNINYLRSYRTSARDGLLAWLCLHKTNSIQASERLQEHMRTYEENLTHKYNSDHELAYKLSQVGKIRKDVFGYLNSEIKKTTLKEMAEGILVKCKRICTILRKEQEDHRHYLSEMMESEKKLREEEYIEEKRNRLTLEARETLRKMLDKVVDEQDEIEATRNTVLWEHIESTYSNNINLQGEFRKVMKILGRKAPLYFEIETNVLTSINELVKDKFVKVLKEGIGRIFDEYEILLEGFSRYISEELRGEYVSAIDRDFKDKIIRENKRKVRDGFEMYASALISRLDSLLVWADISEDELFKNLEIGSAQEIIISNQAHLEKMKNGLNEMRSFVNELTELATQKRFIGLTHKRKLQDKKSQSENVVANIKKQLADLQNSYTKMEKLLNYAYASNPHPAQQLTKIAKLVPKDIKDSDVWDQKARQFNEFLSNVYKTHMENAVNELNEQSWLFVRDNLAETEAQLNDILIKYVFQRLEKIVRDGVDKEFQLKRETKEKMQDLIGEHLKPFSDMERRMQKFMGEIETASFAFDDERSGDEKVVDIKKRQVQQI